jgi:hypothetical protein
VAKDMKVLFIHGIGDGKADFADAAWAILADRHQALTGRELAGSAKVAVCYNDLFEAFRKAPKDGLKEVRPFIQDAAVLEALEDLRGSGNFAYTHVLDVLLWRFHTYARNAVTERVASAIEPFLPGLIQGTTNLVLVAHSLGTAVLTESIHLLAADGRLAGTWLPVVHMVGNVAKVLEGPLRPAYQPPDPSRCRPPLSTTDKDAALLHYFTYRNLCDPVPLVDRFKPDWPEAVYHDTTFRAWGRGGLVNPHDLATYVQAPEVYMKLLRSMTLDFTAFSKEREIQEIQKAAQAPALPAPAEARLREVITSLIAQYGEKATPAAFVKLLQALVIARLL